jgi:cytochrome P450
VSPSDVLPGPIVRISPKEVSFHDLSAAREIHKVGSQYVKSPWYQDLVLGTTSSLFATSNMLLHSRLRRLLSSAIADSSLKQFSPVIMDHIALYITRIEEEMKDRGAADIFKWSTFLATDIIGELSFGESFRMLEQGKVKYFSFPRFLFPVHLVWFGFTRGKYGT